MKIVLTLYFVMSLITFCAYALDKYKAQRRTWRTSEKTLHILELFCGWPGALAAQLLLRHKSHKVSFRVVFWMMVVLNVAFVIFIYRGRL